MKKIKIIVFCLLIVSLINCHPIHDNFTKYNSYIGYWAGWENMDDCFNGALVYSNGLIKINTSFLEDKKGKTIEFIFGKLILNGQLLSIQIVGYKCADNINILEQPMNINSKLLGRELKSIELTNQLNTFAKPFSGEGNPIYDLSEHVFGLENVNQEIYKYYKKLNTTYENINQYYINIDIDQLLKNKEQLAQYCN